MEPIQLSLLTLYLGLTNLKSEDKSDKYLIRILLIACKKAITTKWLQPETPELTNGWALCMKFTQWRS